MLFEESDKFKMEISLLENSELKHMVGELRDCKKHFQLENGFLDDFITSNNISFSCKVSVQLSKLLSKDITSECTLSETERLGRSMSSIASSTFSIMRFSGGLSYDRDFFSCSVEQKLPILRGEIIKLRRSVSRERGNFLRVKSDRKARNEAIQYTKSHFEIQLAKIITTCTNYTTYDNLVAHVTNFIVNSDRTIWHMRGEINLMKAKVIDLTERIAYKTELKDAIHFLDVEHERTNHNQLMQELRQKSEEVLASRRKCVATLTKLFNLQKEMYSKINLLKRVTEATVQRSKAVQKLKLEENRLENIIINLRKELESLHKETTEYNLPDAMAYIQLKQKVDDLKRKLKPYANRSNIRFRSKGMALVAKEALVNETVLIAVKLLKLGLQRRHSVPKISTERLKMGPLAQIGDQRLKKSFSFTSFRYGRLSSCASQKSSVGSKGTFSYSLLSSTSSSLVSNCSVLSENSKSLNTNRSFSSATAEEHRSDSALNPMLTVIDIKSTTKSLPSTRTSSSERHLSYFKKVLFEP